MKIRCFFGSCPNSSGNLATTPGCSCWTSWRSRPSRSSTPSRRRSITAVFLWSLSLRLSGVSLRGSFGSAHCSSLSFPAGELSALCYSRIFIRARPVMRAFWSLSISLTGFSSSSEGRPECMLRFQIWLMAFFEQVIRLKILCCSRDWSSDQYTSNISYCCRWSSSSAQSTSLWHVR